MGYTVAQAGQWLCACICGADGPCNVACMLAPVARVRVLVPATWACALVSDVRIRLFNSVLPLLTVFSAESAFTC